MTRVPCLSHASNGAGSGLFNASRSAVDALLAVAGRLPAPATALPGGHEGAPRKFRAGINHRNIACVTLAGTAVAVLEEVMGLQAA